ncbi:hypothetical protein [Chryseobacterium herbae]|uniref:Lipoprotein n=1 Tax=Chryseobacterium herbae TaxID=2976476 RepID=A0ABT2ISR2_9FLAO|nr:hypothetical protein [Chryseobacterium sp. pc1-10]MCT2561858.1 hypothetical protein [Chryseobacterium sp. pc1-10]
MKLICLVAVFLTFASCKKTEGSVGSVVVEQSLKVSFVNNDKKDILKTLGEVSVSKMRLYYLINGKRILYHDPKLSDPYGIKLIVPNDQAKPYVIQLFLNNVGTLGENVTSTTYLTWEDGREDTIVGTFYNDENNRILAKFKFNGVEGGLKEKEGIVIVRE